jgi:hypothetical protein
MAAPNMGIAELGVQAGYHFTGRIDIGGVPAGSIAPSLRGGDGFVGSAGLDLVLLVQEMLGLRRSKGLGGLDGYGACGHSRTLGTNRLPWWPILNKANSPIRHRERSVA